MNKKNYTWGILGLGKIAETFVTALKSIDDAEFICASRSTDKAKAFAEKHNAKNFYGSYEELTKDENIDIIYIATPMSCHYNDVKLCLENGKNVLCEKAVTINSKQWYELTSIAKAKGLFLMEAMWMKCLPAFRKIKEWINEDRIGEVKMIKADFCCLNKYDENDRLYKKSLGGGSLLDLGVYVLTFACDILGYKPNEIISSMKFGQSGVDFDTSILLKYNNNSFAELTSSFDITSENRAFIIGTKGRIVLPPWFFCTQYAELSDDLTNIIETYNGNFACNGYEYEILEAQKCLNDNLLESYLIPQNETLAIMEIMDEIRKQNGLVYHGFEYEA